MGHGGTLDPLATGALVVAVGAATRFLQYLDLEPKSYSAEFKFGEETNTQDSQGNVTRTEVCPPDLSAAIERELPAFLGNVEQMPPMFSAIKKDGKPLYALAREGQEVDRRMRTIVVHSIRVESVEPPFARFDIRCSGGTYVRTIGHDLGVAVGCGAHMTALRRNAVGKFQIDQSISIEEVSPERMIPLESALEPLPMVTLTPEELQRIIHGNFIERESLPEAKIVGLLDMEGHLVSAARVEGNRLHPECVIPREDSDGEL